MQLFLTIVAIMASITGALLWLAPNILIRLGEILNQEVDAESFIYQRPVFSGSILVIAGSVIIYFIIWG